MQFSPKQQPSNILNGDALRVRNAPKVRTALGLQSMSVQDQYNVAIYGGYISVGQVYTGYFTASYATASYATVNNLTLQAKFESLPVLHTTNGKITDSERVVLVDATFGGTCSGTASNACSTYTNPTACGDNSGHGGCSWNSSIYCDSYNSNQTSCEFYNCTWETYPCSDYDNNQYWCESYTGGMCTWNPIDCTTITDSTYCMGIGCTWDSMTSTCSGTATTGYGTCSGPGYPTGNCLSSGNEGYCYDDPGASCTYFTDSTGCTNETGCTWDTGVTLELPIGSNGRELQVRKIDNTSNPVTLIPDVTTFDVIEGGTPGSFVLDLSNKSCQPNFYGPTFTWWDLSA